MACACVVLARQPTSVTHISHSLSLALVVMKSLHGFRPRDRVSWSWRVAKFGFAEGLVPPRANAIVYCAMQCHRASRTNESLCLLAVFSPSHPEGPCILVGPYLHLVSTQTDSCGSSRRLLVRYSDQTSLLVDYCRTLRQLFALLSIKSHSYPAHTARLLSFFYHRKQQYPARHPLSRPHTCPRHNR